MKEGWKYAVVGGAVTGLFLIPTCSLTGYYYGYYKSEPEMMYLKYETHGTEGLCVKKNAREAVCAVDADNNGSVDLLLVDPETWEVKGTVLGQDDCSKKILRILEKELQNQGQSQEQPKE